ncbi:hypothetical protein IEQ34_002646 [Dendrobium chrysotoxum]|uniref:Uncharacterized protein n=1 Tax=Dendrobium chrysotoxum TaxID=161865 RepID=A0AAV7HJK6_DENCH|nr:hypothetical protein IEQ34_002646 [Dendrobium chrysotoxum]
MLEACLTHASQTGSGVSSGGQRDAKVQAYGVASTTELPVLKTIFTLDVDIDGIREPVSGSLLYVNNIISGAIIPTSAAIACYIGHEWELSFRLGMRPWIVVAYSAPVVAATAIFLIYPIG